MTHVHYKFSSKLGYDTVVLDGPHITLGELKRQIMCREKLRAGDCDLQITNAQTKEEYTEDEGPIPKGSSVIVRRIPTRGGKSSSSSKTTKIERSVSQSHHSFDVAKAMDDHTSPSTLHFFSKMANLADADASEEDKIKVMLNQSIYDSMNYNKKFASALPANYTCYRCGNTGHHIRNCPSSGDKNFEAPLKIKKSTGIPRSFMVEVDDPNTKGAMLTNCGRYAIPAIDAEAYAVGKKERPPFVPQEKPISEPEEDPVPDELLCLICHELLSDAVVIPCCGNSYCDDCIRSTLLDSEEHVCPTCGQQNVSPDTLIANKFLRQAVNNFKKERGYTKSKTGICDSSQSQNPTPAPSPVPTPPPPLTVQSQPQKQHQSSCSQQAADIQPLLENPPAAAAGPTSDTSDGNMFTTSLQTEQRCLDIPDKEAEEEAQDDSAAAAEDEDAAAAAAPPAAADAVVAPPPAVVADDDPTAPPSQLIPVVNETTVAEQPQSDQQQSSSGPAPGSSSCWQSSSASSGCPTRGWTESQQLTPSPSLTYSATAPPLFPSPLYHPYLSAHHSHSSYPPGYPPPPPIWTLPCPQGAPIPSLCSSTPTPSIPALIPKEWYRYQRKKERSPDRGSTYRRSSSRSYVASSKSKSSRSYSRSSSRSRSRSRSKSQGKSRPRSPYSRHRALHTRSHPSYNYGYKRSPTPSSSSSPQVGHHSRAKSPSDHRKNRHHHHHHTRKSASSGSSSTRRGERSKRDEGRHGGRSTSSQVTQSSSVDLDRERHLQWNKQYNEWCEKYFSSYINHFHQLPLSFINLPPPPQFDGSKYYSHTNSDSRHRPSALMDDHSRSSTDSRSPPSHSSSSSRSTPSQSSSDSCSSSSNTPDSSRSPPSQMSCNGRLTQSEDWTERREYRQHKNAHSPDRKGSEEEEELQDRSKDGKKEMTGNLEDHRSINSEQRETKKYEAGRGEESSSPRASNSTGDNRNDERRHITGPHSISVWDEATFRPHKSLDEDRKERKSKENRDLEEKKRRLRGKDSKSRHNVSRQHKTKSSKRDDTEYRNPGGSKATDLSSVGDRKTKVETPEKRETHESKSPNPFEKKRQKSEQKKQSKTSPLWEGRITVKPPKKISININLDGKWKEGKIEDQQNITGKPKEEMEAERNLKTEETVEVNEKNESGRREGAAFEDKLKPEGGDSKDLRQRTIIRDDKRVMWTNTGREDAEDGDFEFWHFEEELARDDWRRLTAKEEEEGAVREENEGQERANRGTLPGKWKAVEVMVEGRKRRMREEDDEMRFKTQRSSNEGPGSNVESDSSTGDCQEQRTMVKMLEEFIQDKDAESEDQLIHIQAPPSKWEKEEFKEEEQIDRDVKPQEPFPAGLPPPLLVTPPNMETEGENEVMRQRSVDTKRDEDRAVHKGRGENEKPFTLLTLDRFVAPSSGKITADSTLHSDRERGRTTEVEKCRDRERGRDSERSRDRQRETKRTMGEGRDRSRERRHHKKSLPSSSHSSPYSTSQDVEKRDRQRRDDRGKSPRSLNPADKISTSRTTEVPDKHRTTADRDRKPKHRDYHDHRNATGNRAAGSRSSSPSLSHRKHRHPDLKLLLKRSRDGNKEEKEEWKRNEVMRESKEERESKKIEAERVSGGPYKSTAERWEGGGGVVVEEGERRSSSSSSSSGSSSSSSSGSGSSSSSSSSLASHESSKYDGRKERKKRPKTERREKNEAAMELLEERELQEHGHKKKSKRGEDEREAESRGDSSEFAHAHYTAQDDESALLLLILITFTEKSLYSLLVQPVIPKTSNGLLETEYKSPPLSASLFAGHSVSSFSCLCFMECQD
ncbi:E3 ubiquitin-protein ligase RBBP6 isoform X2 [Solea senegalensis]|uniref:E3 ubiquitin-protein ligase RBBP6 isoform X2 n=1 Tax=Solea senegalensis TaxID=28829 RepID=A0AAV6RKB0_SOLSE|nr:E3 ubiquitin-protein ligase RBBP6 isoform X2 [Solea senegalensis]